MNRRTIIAGAGAFALVVAAALAVSTAPNDTSIVDAFEVTGGVGQLVTARLMSAEVHEVRLAHELDVPYGFDDVNGTTNGVWVVVDATLTAQVQPIGTGYSELHIGDYVFKASDILPIPALTDVTYGAGVPVTGTLVFEVPSSALALPGAATATLVVRELFTAQLDSVPAIRMDLSALSIEKFATIGAAYVGDEADATR
ncbi:MAG: hypothetical protein ABJB03_04890 [Rhodoglobus sp.]